MVSCAAGDLCPDQGGGGIAPQRLFYLFKYDPPNVPELTGADLSLKGTRQDFDPRTNQPIVTLDFTDKGGDKFHDITRTLAQRGRLLYNTVGGGQGDPDIWNQNFAVVLDREIKSWPQIDFTEYPSGIDGGNGAIISGNFTVQEAKDLALVLQTGALPVKFVTLDQTEISATLGKDSLEEAKTAAIVGLLLVALFLLMFYRLLGLIAVFGLVDLRGNAVRRDPAARRDADPARIRGTRAHARCRGRRERRHLRTREGRGARREKCARSHLAGLHEGLRDDHRRERRHDDHGARPVRGRNRERARVRADAADRHRDLDADRRRSRRGRC